MAHERSPIPMPAHIHYELLLQLLEQQTAQSIHQQFTPQPSAQKEQLQALIITLRKAFSQQKHLEESCQRAKIPLEYHWSLNQSNLASQNSASQNLTLEDQASEKEANAEEEWPQSRSDEVYTKKCIVSETTV
jgi:hypothetical protein